MQQLQIPPLAEGEIYIGAIGNKNGDFHHVILLPGDNDGASWQAQIEKTLTKTGLKVTADILDGVYEAGRTVTRHVRASLNIAYDSTLPSWNYSIRSRNGA
jgi:hypothetical protein